MRNKTLVFFISALVFLVSVQCAYAEKKVVTLDDLKKRFSDKNADDKSADKDKEEAVIITHISKKVEPGESNRLYVKFKIKTKGWHEVKIRVVTLDSDMKVIELLDNGLTDDKIVSDSWINGSQFKGGHLYGFEFPYTKNYKYAVAEITFGERESKQVIKKASTSRINVNDIIMPDAGESAQ
ncbi:MAG: hypothetical protein PHO00_08755 [bacterium]|nr:hypothetical protein [bacterium]